MESTISKKIRITASRIYAWLLQSIPLKAMFGRWNRTIGSLPSRLLSYPTAQVRKFLQLFIQSVSSTRYLMHLFVLSISLTISLGGFARMGGVGHAATDENRYVVAFGSQASSDRYAAVLEGGYLVKSTVAITSISTRLVAGVQEYVVQPGDTLSVIARTFGISSKTIQWANQITDVNRLKPGQALVILPVSGVVRTVGEGETLETIAGSYGVSQDELIAANELVPPVRLAVSQQLVVPLPDASIPDMPKPEPVIASSHQDSGYTGGVSTANVGSVVGDGQFGWPTSGKITKTCRQHSWRDCAIDIASRQRPGVYASDAGVVTVAGWIDNYGYGNRIEIDHGNGFITRYAHLDDYYVSPGEQVSKGQLIGKMGCTGRCSGPHLHFMIIESGTPRDPMSYL